MITAPAYIAVRLFQRLIGFFSHWYVGGTRVFWTRTIEILGSLARFFGKPSDRDTAGFVLWGLRLFVGAIIYIIVSVASLVLYIFWALLIPYVILKILEGFVL